MVSEDYSESIDERRTRKKYIDPELAKRKWILKYVKEEVNSVKSDFANKRFVFYDGNPEKGVDSFSTTRRAQRLLNPRRGVYCYSEHQ